MNGNTLLRASVSAFAVFAATSVQAQTASPTGGASTSSSADSAAETRPGASDAQASDIVVTGFRQSLARAAEIKRDAVQVVDSIVAEDIGKFPDPTTAAALQRVPGVQVTVANNGEIQGVVIRGLADILSTLDGREVFSAVGRGFALQDLPAIALARVNVVKSSTANLIEGGIAGITDLQLNKPFNFRDPTIVASARANYSKNADKTNPQLGVLLTNRWDTPIGEIGALVNVSYSYFDYSRPISFVAEQRSLSTAPYSRPGVLSRNTVGGSNELGWYKRPQVNGSLQWQATPSLQIYADGLVTGYITKNVSAFNATALFFPETTTSSVTVDSNCFTARVSGSGYTPTVLEIARGQISATNPNGGFRVEQLCNLASGHFDNARALTSSQAREQKSYNYIGALGLKWEQDSNTVVLDASYQKSTNKQSTVIVDVGKRVSLDLQTNVDKGGIHSHPGNPLGDPAGFFLRNGLNQNFQKSIGDLKQVRVDATHDFDGAFGFLKSLQFGVRYADRGAVFQQAVLNRAVADLTIPVAGGPLPSDFLTLVPGIARINGGAGFLIPDPDYLRSANGRDVLRGVYSVPLGDPPYQGERRFEANEKTYAGYLQLGYEVPLGGPVVLDGLIGVRPTRTERTITGAGLVSGAVVTRNRDTTDTDWLPNASARLRLGGGLQARATYAKAIRRPEFSSLNPGLNYTIATNPAVQNSGSAGNPDLRPQKSESFDATLEYYWKSNFVAVAGFDRKITDRVITAATAEEIDGIIYNISRPRNVGKARLKGVEISGQLFFDFLPGALSGLGVSSNFTYVDSKVGGQDVLAGYEIQGVSKYNYNASLIFEKYGFSGRVAWTYRGKYFDADNTGLTVVRAIDPARVNELTYNPVALNMIRPGGRLDFGVGYDLTRNIRIDVGGSNILRNKYRSYYDVKYLNRDYRVDDTTYTAGIRVRI